MIRICQHLVEPGGLLWDLCGIGHQQLLTTRGLPVYLWWPWETFKCLYTKDALLVPSCPLPIVRILLHLCVLCAPLWSLNLSLVFTSHDFPSWADSLACAPKSSLAQPSVVEQEVLKEVLWDELDFLHFTVCLCCVVSLPEFMDVSQILSLLE